MNGQEFQRRRLALGADAKWFSQICGFSVDDLANIESWQETLPPFVQEFILGMEEENEKLVKQNLTMIKQLMVVQTSRKCPPLVCFRTDEAFKKLMPELASGPASYFNNVQHRIQAQLQKEGFIAEIVYGD
jgi:hypothetical protein